MLEMLMMRMGGGSSLLDAEIRLLASDGTVGDLFGYSVSISGDGSTAIVGSHYDDDLGADSGNTYVYNL